MKKDDVVAVVTEDGLYAADLDAQIENPYVIRFGAPFVFEGAAYEAIDLSALAELSAGDLIAAQRYLSRNGGAGVVLPEMDYMYCCKLAADAAKLPYEFFTRLPARDAVKVKTVVSGFLFGEG